MRNNTTNDRNNLHILGWHTGESPDVFTVFGSVLLRSDHPFSFYQNPRIMRNNSDGLRKRYQFTPTPFEIEYWRKIHDLNQEKSTTQKPAPVFVVTTIELVETEEVN